MTPHRHEESTRSEAGMESSNPPTRHQLQPTVTEQPTGDGATPAPQRSSTAVANTMVRWGPGEMGRGCCWTVFSCPYRASQASCLSSITEQQRDFAHFANVSYSDPSDRPVELRGYDLLRDEIPLWGDDSGATEPLNGVRWMVYRHPNRVNHALVFRGTVDRLDIKYDAHLLTKGLAEHELMMDSAAWALRAMLFLERRARDEREHAGGGGGGGGGDGGGGGGGGGGDDGSSEDPPEGRTCLKFWVVGHSLGGATAMGVMLLLNNIPAMDETLKETAKKYKNRRKFSEVYEKEVVEVYTAAVADRGTNHPYDLVGGDVFNAGSAPRCLVLSHPCIALFGCLSLPACVISRIGLFFYRCCAQRRQHGLRADQLVTSHHVLCDPISMTFHMGKEKSYWPNALKTHGIEGFLHE